MADKEMKWEGNKVDTSERERRGASKRAQEGACEPFNGDSVTTAYPEDSNGTQLN